MYTTSCSTYIHVLKQKQKNLFNVVSIYKWVTKSWPSWKMCGSGLTVGMPVNYLQWDNEPIWKQMILLRFMWKCVSMVTPVINQMPHNLKWSSNITNVNTYLKSPGITFFPPHSKLVKLKAEKQIFCLKNWFLFSLTW